MGPLAEYEQNLISYNKPIIRERIIWADERRIPLASEGADEDDLINKFHVDNITVHHKVNSSQLRSAIASAKKIAFGPKYNDEGKLDFYSQNQFIENESHKEDISDFENEAQYQQNQVEQIQRAKFVPVANTRSNDLNSFNKRSLNTKQSKKSSNKKPVI